MNGMGEMSELGFLGAVAGLYFMLAASPGPNFLVITHSAANESRRHAVCVGLGISAASVLWATLAAAGLGLLMQYFAGLQRVLQVLGGLYLVYLGWRMLRSDGRPAAATGTSGRSPWQSWRFGLATNLTNPKSLAFFSSAFATLFTPGLPGWLQAGAVAVVGLVSITWNLLVIGLFSTERARLAYGRAKLWLDRVTGGLLAFFGLKLVLGR